MGMPARQRRFDVAEYLDLENDADERHEYQDGKILAMSGGCPEQSFIIANFVGEARSALKGKPCRVAESNLRVRIPTRPRYMYPDASIICGALEFDPQDPRRQTIINPKVIIEVLSPSTEAYDRGDKFTQYREIPAFAEYILISPDRPNVESFLRQADGAWSILSVNSLDAAATIRSLGISIPMSEIYAGIDWPPSAS